MDDRSVLSIGAPNSTTLEKGEFRNKPARYKVVVREKSPIFHKAYVHYCLPLIGIYQTQRKANYLLRLREKNRTTLIEASTKRQNQKQKENKRIFVGENRFPCVSEECIGIRRLWINKDKNQNPDDSFIIDAHCGNCDSCARWIVYGKNHAEGTDESDYFAKPDFKHIGANPYDSNTKEEP